VQSAANRASIFTERKAGIETMLKHCTKFGRLALFAILFAQVAGAQVKVDDISGPFLSSQQELNLLALLKALQLGIDRSQFDPKALLDALDYDEKKIVEFVKSNISFEQYPGILKGPRSTLGSRGGNAADQSLLLATLLKDAGFDARILRGRISDDAARILLANISPSLEHASPFLHPEESRRVLKNISLLLAEYPSLPGRESSINAENELSPLLKFTQNKDILVATLKDEGVDLSNTYFDAGLVEETRDYYWVEFKIGAAGTWQEAHPALPTGQHLEVDTIAIFSDEIPKELQHRIRLNVKISQQVAGKTHTSDLIESWERPVANLAGTTITYKHLALNSRSNDGNMNSSASVGAMFLPQLNGTVPAGAQVFDERGNVLPMDVAASVMAGIIKAIGNKILSATETISGLEREHDDTLMSLENLWLEVELIPPFEKDATRIIRQLIQQSETAYIESLGSQSVAMTIGVGRPSTAEMMYRALGDLLVLLGHRDIQSSTELNSTVANLLGNSFFSASNAQNAFNGTTTSYYSAPAIFAQHHDVLIENQSYSGFDVMNNQRRAFDLNTEVALSKLVNVEMGVWESMIEAWLGEQTLSARTFSIIDSLGLVQTDKRDRRLVNAYSESGGWHQGVEIGDLSKELMALDKEAGYMIFVPNSSGLSWSNVNVWWRVNPNTGETLGRGGPVGWGATYAETTALLEGIEWMTCVFNVAAKCRDQVAWAFAITHFVAQVGEQALDPSGKPWSWWDVLKYSPMFQKLKALLKRKTGVDIDRYQNPEAWINDCIEKTITKPKEEGGCGDPVPWPE
jgi:hypothetical protein